MGLAALVVALAAPLVALVGLLVGLVALLVALVGLVVGLAALLVKGLALNFTGRPQSTQFPCTTMWLGTGLENATMAEYSSACKKTKRSGFIRSNWNSLLRPSVADGGRSVGGVLLEVFVEHLGELVGLVVEGGGGFPSVAGV